MMRYGSNSKHAFYVGSDKKGIRYENHNENLPESRKGHLIVDKVGLLAFVRQTFDFEIVWRYRNCANQCGTDTKLVEEPSSPTARLF